MTSVPFPVLGPTGFQAPQENEILAGVQSDLNQAFGGGLNQDLSTPQGQIATSMAAIIGNVNDTFLNLTQQFDPAYNSGRYQDAIARIYFLERKPSLPTVVEAICSGAIGTVIPLGALAQAVDGSIYECTVGGTIGLSGSVSCSFTNITPGAISCAAGNLNTIYQTIIGWDSIFNPTDGVIGQDVENRRDFEERRFDSVANNAMGFLNAILGAVWELDGVIDAYVTENFTGSPVTIGGVSVAAHSLYVAVTGGSQDEVAKAIWSKKAPGCDMTGNTTVTVYDDQAGYDPPLPSYQIKFQVPAQLPILFDVSLADNPQIPANGVELVQNAIISAFAGGDGGLRARIGSTIYASRFYAPVAALGPWVQIISIDVGSFNTPASTFTGSIGASGTVGVGRMTVTALAGGTLSVGQYLYGTIGGGTAVIMGSRILAQLSGSAGGTGVYSISMTYVPISSTTIKGALANQNFVQCQIDQQPVTGPDVIEVDTT